jgi:MFS superfamily sulfate permease-like transporter
MASFFKNISSDFPSSIVVFLVALPLCLGVAVASDAAPVTGLIAGMVGGIVVGFLSGSPLSVSGPAAGLTAIVATAIGKMPTYEIFLVSVVMAGVFQILLGFLKAGIIGDFIPNSVIKGMLAAIGIILILKQMPHLVGYDLVLEGDESFAQAGDENTFTTLLQSLERFNAGAVIIGIVSVGVLLLFDTKFFKSNKILKLVPGALIVVFMGIGINSVFIHYYPELALQTEHLVQLDIFDKPAQFFQSLPFPDFSAILKKEVLLTAFTIALVASIETLLSLEAIDKIDPQKRISPTNRELKAQGIGNIVSGLLGGIPVTSVIVRSSANVSSGGKSKLSSMLHGGWLLLSVLFIPGVLNLIPLAALAAILILIGYKLAKIQLFREHYKAGFNQFFPFVVTILAILLTNLLIGILIGIVTGFFFVLRTNFVKGIFIQEDEGKYLIRFRRNVSFLNKAMLKSMLEKIPDDSAVLFDASQSEFMDNDIVDLVNDFVINAETRGIRVYFKQINREGQYFFEEHKDRVVK